MQSVIDGEFGTENFGMFRKKYTRSFLATLTSEGLMEFRFVKFYLGYIKAHFISSGQSYSLQSTPSIIFKVRPKKFVYIYYMTHEKVYSF